MGINALYRRTVFWVKDFFNGSPIRKPYNEIKFLSTSSFHDGENLRHEKLKSLLLYASQNTQFYSGIDSASLADFPVMNKASLLENYDLIKVQEDKIPGQVGKLHIQSTSGSTGTPFAIPQDTRKRQRRIAELKYFGAAVGFKTHEKLIHLRTWNRWQNKTSKQIKSENIVPFDISSMSQERLSELTDLMGTSKAVCLRGYASSFDLLAEYVKANGGEFPSLKIIIAGSESLHDDVRRKVKKYLKCEIISQYANEECGILAQEQPPTLPCDNIMYLNHAGYVFEMLKPDSDQPAEYGELARIVVTDLHNYAFPIIRYDTGDVGIMCPPDERSNGYPVLGKLYGRRFDVCYNTKGEPFFPMTVGRVLKHYEQIRQWQFVQTGQKEYVLKITPAKGAGESEFDDALIVLREVLGEDAVLSVQIVDEIPVLSSGKRKPVLNEWKR